MKEKFAKMRADIQKEWEEDIRENLKRRRDRISELKDKVKELNDEIAKEVEYVTYLEKLLEFGPQPALPADNSDPEPPEPEPGNDESLGTEGDDKPGVNYITVIKVKDEDKKVPPKPPPKRPPLKMPQVPAPSKYGCVVFNSKNQDELLELYKEPLDVVRTPKSSSSDEGAEGTTNLGFL